MGRRGEEGRGGEGRGGEGWGERGGEGRGGEGRGGEGREGRDIAREKEGCTEPVGLEEPQVYVVE